MHEPLQAVHVAGYPGEIVPERSLRRVLVLYNTDYDAELIASVDVSAVRVSAQAVTEAALAAGYDTELLGVHGLDLGEVIAAVRARAPDLVFNLCESLAGDARNEMVMPAVLDMLRVPYTGSDALALGLCLHKDRCKEILSARGVPTPEHVVIRDQRELDAAALDALAYPYFVKLAHEDASIGIDASNRVRSRAELVARATELLATYRQPVLCERYIDGRELNVTLLGTGAQAQVLPLHEIDFSAMPAGRPRIVSYAAKWDESHIDYAGTRPVPLRDVPAALYQAIEDASRGAFAALGVRDYGRVDLRVDDRGVPWVIDVNPNCDVSPDAGVARAAASAGMSYPALVGRICELAWRRCRGGS